MGRKITNRKCIRITSKKVSIEPLQPELLLIHDIFKGNEFISSINYSYLYFHLNRILNMLSEKEKIVIENYYGLFNKKRLTMNEIAPMFNCTASNIQLIRNRTLRKLRQPRFCKHLRNYNYFYSSKFTEDNNASTLIKKIYDDFVNYIFHHKKKSKLLESMFKTFNISISRKYCEVPQNIDELDFSVRCYHTLRRNGIRTIEELTKLTDDDLMNLRLISKKTFKILKEEIEEQLAKNQLNKETVSLTIKSPHYNSHINEIDNGYDIFKSVFPNIYDLEDLKQSAQLTLFLLQNGCLSLEDIINKQSDLKKKAKKLDGLSIYEELLELFSYLKDLKNLHYIGILVDYTDDLYNFVSVNENMPLKKLLSLSKNNPKVYQELNDGYISKIVLNNRL